MNALKVLLIILIMNASCFCQPLLDNPTLTLADKELWMRCIKRVQMKPPCCGACKLLTSKDAKAIWEYLISNVPEKKQGKNLAVWLEHKDRLLDEFKNLNPKRHKELYKGGANK